ncbi:MAG: oligosaccharide flippase family protein [Pseudomonadota bacterium]
MSAKFIFGSSAGYLAVTIADNAARLLLLPWMTRILTPADYGVMLLISNGAALINLLFGFGLAQALPTLFSNAEMDSSRRAVSTTIILSIGGILSALYLATALLSHEISVFFLHTPSYSGVIALGALSAFLNAWSLCLVFIVRLVEKHKLYPMVQMPALILQVGLLGWFIASASLTIKSQYIATTLAGLFTTAAYVVTLRYWLTGSFQIKKLAEATRIGVQMLPWQIAVLLATSSAAFFLTRAGHVNDSGLFLVATGAAGLLVLLSSSFEGVWTPFILRRKDEPDIAKTQVRIFSLYSATLLIAAAILCVFAHELFVVLAGPAFRSGYLFVPGLAIAYCLFCFVNGFAQGLQARQRTIHYSWIGAIASAVFLATALSLTPGCGAWGIIAAMIGSFLVMLILLQWASARFMPVAYPWFRHGLMWAVAAGIVTAVFSLEVGWASAAVKLLALMGIATLPFLFGAIRVSDLHLAKSLLLPAR